MPPLAETPLNAQKKLVFWPLILLIHKKHHNRLRLRLQEKREQRFKRVYVPQVPISYERRVFRLDTCGWDEVDFCEYLRFSKVEIRQVVPCLQLEKVRWHCIKIFGCSRTRISVIFNDLIAYLISRYAETLWWDKRRLNYMTLRRYENTIYNITGLRGVWGFSYYSGYKKTHAFKFQSIVTPDGLLSSLIGPFPGPVGDWTVWKASGIDVKLREMMEEHGVSESDRLYVYGDSAYLPVLGVLGLFLEHVGRPLERKEEAANLVMSGERIVVEWGFGHIINYWALNSFRNSLKVGLSPVAGYYMVATLLSNSLLCITGTSQVSEKYNLAPPRIEEYLYVDTK
ncbi:hypothetical protein L873DRAFT_1835601 [Choiromyces venosus 120613-1]|uniref:DDE Tnp4 domain-containing protein n=1 Tax=Choiromyces venosus 120613-1 TaxID=1336337 RepID=A0A3N4JQG0_9PEZI|nr:hypothetical protein L873DRAFT_1835601 [Choiromyces venosus 120613-1]